MSNKLNERDITLNTEGYIRQLLEYQGKKGIQSIVPHTFRVVFYKTAGQIPFMSSLNNNNACFYGTIIATSESVSASLGFTYPRLDGNFMFPFDKSLTSKQYDGVFFDDFYTDTNFADVSANTFRQYFYFTGYKIHYVK